MRKWVDEFLLDTSVSNFVPNFTQFGLNRFKVSDNPYRRRKNTVVFLNRSQPIRLPLIFFICSEQSVPPFSWCERVVLNNRGNAHEASIAIALLSNLLKECTWRILNKLGWLSKHTDSEHATNISCMIRVCRERVHLRETLDCCVYSRKSQ